MLLTIKEGPLGLPLLLQRKLPGGSYTPEAFKESLGISQVEKGDGQDILNEGYTQFNALDNICFLTEALTKGNMENCEVGEEGIWGWGEPFRAFITPTSCRWPAFLSCVRWVKREG